MIREDPKYKYFINTRQLADQTINRYTRELTLYTESTGLSPSELIEEARHEQINKPWMDERQLPLHLAEHINFMEDKDYAPYRIRIALNIIRTFYKEFSVHLPYNQIQR